VNDIRFQQQRLIAAAIDIGIGMALVAVVLIGGLILSLIAGSIVGTGAGFIWRLVVFGAALVSVAYVLGRDSLAQGRSFGKKIQEIHVVTGTGAVTITESVKRNAIFAVGPAIWLITAMIHLVPLVGEVAVVVMIPLNMLGGIVSVAAVIVEVIKILQDPQGLRFGDQFAGTRVIE
jgi:hypothetical protein